MKSIAIITARGGSKRIPKKNIKDFLGKPIIAYTIEAAIESKLFNSVMVSTDSEEIAEISKKYGAEVPFLRSKKNSDDYSTTDDVLLEVLEEYKKRGEEFDIMACLYPTAPFLNAEKIKSAWKILTEKNAGKVMSVVKFSFPPQRALLLRDELVYQYPEFEKTRSQDLEPIYHDAGCLYIWNTDFFYNTEKNLKVLPLILSDYEVQDIDTLSDWKIAEAKYSALNNSK